MSNIKNKLSALQLQLAKNSSHHLFVRFHTRERHITGPLQGLSVDANGTVTCFFGENRKTDVVEIAKSDLFDLVLFCDADRRPMFLRDFRAEIGESDGELSFQPEVPPSEGIRLNLLEQAREEAVTVYRENVEVFESLRE